MGRRLKTASLLTLAFTFIALWIAFVMAPTENQQVGWPLPWLPPLVATVLLMGVLLRDHADLHLPFWVFDATVRIDKRQAVKKRLLSKERPSTDHGEFWRETRQFYVPAFDTRLENLRAWGVDLTRRQPNLPPGEGGRLRGCIYTEAEARELAELIFLGIEFDKPDILQEIDYSLTLTSPRLLVVAFVEESR